MYVDPNVGGVLFQVLAAIFAAVSGLILVFSGRLRSAIARFRRRLRERYEDPKTPEGSDPSSSNMD